MPSSFCQGVFTRPSFKATKLLPLASKNAMDLRPHGGHFHGHASRTPHEIQLEFDQLWRAIGIRCCAHPGEATPETPLKRSDTLPL